MPSAATFQQRMLRNPKDLGATADPKGSEQCYKTPYTHCQWLQEGVCIARDVRELLCAPVEHLLPCMIEGEAPYIFLSALLNGYWMLEKSAMRRSQIQWVI